MGRAVGYRPYTEDRRDQLGAIVAGMKILTADWQSGECSRGSLDYKQRSECVEIWLGRVPRRFPALQEMHSEMVVKRNDYSSVVQAADIDLRPVVLSEFVYPGRVLCFVRTRAVSPRRDESGELLLLDIPALGIEAFGSTRSELIASIRDELDFLWRRIALQPDASLSTKARELKAALLGEITES